MKKYFSNHKAVFAFNIWDIDSAKAVMDAAGEYKQNIILQTSSSVYTSLPQKQLKAFVTSYASDLGIMAWLHLDHCRDIQIIEDAIMHGWDSVMIDASDKEIEENIQITNYVTKIAHEQHVFVEAEVGQVKGVEEEIVVTQSLVASKSDIDLFLQKTAVDMIAVAFGNAHGRYRGEPVLHYDLIRYVAEKCDIPFVVHGGSGLSDEILLRLLSIEQVKKINISTDLKYAYRKGIIEAYNLGYMEEDGFQASGVVACISDEIGKEVRKKLDLLINEDHHNG